MFDFLKSTLLLIVALSAVKASPIDLSSRQAVTCSTGIHMMLASGCAKPCTAGDQIQLLQSMVDSINSTFPGSDLYIVPYTGSATEALSDSPVMIAEATAYAAACPTTPITFLGYSLGGIIIMNTLCGVATGSIGLSQTPVLPNVIAAITYGEETRVAGMPYDFGTCTNNAPTYARNDTAQCAAYGPILRSYCNSDDPACCAGGTNSSAHFTYATQYQNDSMAWIVSQYASYQSVLAAHPSTTSSTVLPTSTTSSSSIPMTTTTASSTSSSKSTSSTSTVPTSTSTTSHISTLTSHTSSSSIVKPTPTPPPQPHPPQPWPQPQHHQTQPWWSHPFGSQSSNHDINANTGSKNEGGSSWSGWRPW